MKELCIAGMFQRVGGWCEPIRKCGSSLTPEQSSRTNSKELRKTPLSQSRICWYSAERLQGNKSGGTAVKEFYRPEILKGISGLFACIYERCEGTCASSTKRCLHRIWTACTRTFIARQRGTKQMRSVCEWHREGKNS